MSEFAIKKTWSFEDTDIVRQCETPDGVLVYDARDIFGPLCIKNTWDAMSRIDADERYLVNTEVPTNQHGGTKAAGVNYITFPGVCKILATTRQRTEWPGRSEIAVANAKVKRLKILTHGGLFRRT